MMWCKLYYLIIDWIICKGRVEMSLGLSDWQINWKPESIHTSIFNAPHVLRGQHSIPLWFPWRNSDPQHTIFLWYFRKKLKAMHLRIYWWLFNYNWDWNEIKLIIPFIQQLDTLAPLTDRIGILHPHISHSQSSMYISKLS